MLAPALYLKRYPKPRPPSRAKLTAAEKAIANMEAGIQAVQSKEFTSPNSAAVLTPRSCHS